MNAIQCEHLTKIYPKVTAVDDLNLTVKEGELFALLGVNGAGKTTTVKMLSTLSAPTSGDAILLGKSIVHDREDVKRLIAISPQETAVAPNLTVFENLQLIAAAYGFGKKEANEKSEAIAKQFGLDAVRNRRAGKLSGGWQRRISIAMALIGDPKILFLDEPTLGLDVLARAELWEMIRALKGTVTTILTTHYMEEAEMLSDRVGIMKEGKLLAIGTVEKLKTLTGCEKLEDAFVSLIRKGAAQ